MREERNIAELARTAVPRVWWSAIFAGVFFSFGIMLILSFFGLAIGAAMAVPQGPTERMTIWAGVWSLVTAFMGFFCGGWIAARLSGGQAKPDGRLHGLVTWAVGSTMVFYLAVTSSTRLAGVLSVLTPNFGRAAVNPALIENMTVTAATWTLLAAICGLIGGLLGGHSGILVTRPSATVTRRAA